MKKLKRLKKEENASIVYLSEANDSLTDQCRASTALCKLIAEAAHKLLDENKQLKVDLQESCLSLSEKLDHARKTADSMAVLNRELQATVTEQMHQLAGREAKISELEGIITDGKTENKRLCALLDELRKQGVEIHDEVSDLRKKIKGKEEQVDRLVEDNQASRTRRDALLADNKRLTAQIDKLQAELVAEHGTFVPVEEEAGVTPAADSDSGVEESIDEDIDELLAMPHHFFHNRLNCPACKRVHYNTRFDSVDPLLYNHKTHSFSCPKTGAAVFTQYDLTGKIPLEFTTMP